MIKISGGTYAAFYHGDKSSLPQFTGGVKTAYPNDEVVTVTVPANAKPEDFIWHDFVLAGR